MFRGVHSVMYFVDDVASALKWYSRLLSINPIEVAPDFSVLTVDGVEVCFHRADEKGRAAWGGSVVYWRVDNFDKSRTRAEILGASLHRGPLAIEGQRQIAQFRDPFGNLFGIVAPA